MRFPFDTNCPAATRKKENGLGELRSGQKAKREPQGEGELLVEGGEDSTVKEGFRGQMARACEWT